MKYRFRKLSLLFLLANIMIVAYGQEPNLFMTRKDFANRLLLAQREPWAQQSLAALIKEADDFPRSYTDRFGLADAVPPPEGGQWLHWYVCPDSGRALQFHPPDQNICPDTGKNFAGYPFDHVVYQLRNDALGESALALGLSYRFTNKPIYAQEAAEILKAYARIYPTYVLHDNYGKQSPNGARAYSQTLDESIWLIKIAWTYDLIRGADVLSVADKQEIEQNLLRASAATVCGAHKDWTNNIQAWINGAMASVGYTLNDSALVSEAIDGPIGFRHQMHEYVHEGFWIEGAWGYQFYAMRPLTMLAQMASRKGHNLWKEEPALLTLFRAPLGVVLPDGRLPAFNDSTAPNLVEQSYLFEVAYAATGDPALLRLLGHSSRLDREAFLFGVEHLPPTPPEHLDSTVFSEAGYAALRSSTSDQTVIMKFGNHGGGHGHYDKLNFVLNSNRVTLAIDPGTQLYGLPLHSGWDSKTIAHNTISVDQQRQQAATGKLLNWHTEAGWTAVRADAGLAYAQARLQRTMLLTPDYVLIIDHCVSSDGKPHTYDWAYHNAGKETLSSPVAMHPYVFQSAANGYDYLHNVKRGESSDAIQLAFVANPSASQFVVEHETNSVAATHLARGLSSPLPAAEDPEVRLALQILGAPGTTIFTGDAPGPDLRIPVPFVIVRRSGTSATFVTVLATSTQQSAGVASRITLQQIGEDRYMIGGTNFSDTFVDGVTFSLEHHMN